jgi:hypothetical protein
MNRLAATTVLVFLLLRAQAGHAAPDSAARTAEQAVLATYQKMEEADRKGDGELWLALRGKATRDSMDAALKDIIRKGGRSRPQVRYEPIATRTLGARSVILGRVSHPDSNSVQYDAVLFVLEDGEWKVDREQWSEKPIDSFVLYALLQPADGVFIREGAPWKSIPFASSNPDVVRKEDVVWKVQATTDESFLYVRFQSTQTLPAPGAKLRSTVGKTGGTGGPAAPPAMAIKRSGAGLYEFAVTPLVAIAAGDRYSVSYKLAVKKSEGEEVFAITVGEGSRSFLVTVNDHSIDVRIPMDALGSDEGKTSSFDLEEADTVNRVLPYHVQAYRKP